MKRGIFRNFERKCVFKNRQVYVYVCMCVCMLSLLYKVTQFDYYNCLLNIRWTHSNESNNNKVFRNPVSSSFDRSIGLIRFFSINHDISIRNIYEF